MWPAPDDPNITHRMRAAHRAAQTALNVHAEPGSALAWGWRARTFSQEVTAADGLAWLRVAAALDGQIDPTFWNGSLDAATAIPQSVPRPRLRAVHDWTDGRWHYRAELYDRATAPPVSDSATLTTAPDLPRPWWTAVRAALDAIAAVPTDRHTITQQYLDHAMPRHLGTPIGTTAVSWTTAHGDFHFANLCAPSMQILDWEGWGLAPTGYDAAILHTHALLVPATANQVRRELAYLLDTPTGRYAELVAITELLDSTTRDDNLHLLEPLRDRAAQLLRRPIPTPVATATPPKPATLGRCGSAHCSSSSMEYACL